MFVDTKIYNPISLRVKESKHLQGFQIRAKQWLLEKSKSCPANLVISMLRLLMESGTLYCTYSLIQVAICIVMYSLVYIIEVFLYKKI